MTPKRPGPEDVQQVPEEPAPAHVWSEPDFRETLQPRYTGGNLEVWAIACILIALTINAGFIVVRVLIN